MPSSPYRTSHKTRMYAHIDTFPARDDRALFRIDVSTRPRPFYEDMSREALLLFVNIAIDYQINTKCILELNKSEFMEAILKSLQYSAH